MRAPATSSALSIRIVSIALRPIEPMTSSTAILLRDELDQRQQQLSVGFCELLDGGSRALLFPIDDVVRLLHGGGVLLKDGFGESILSNRLRHRRLTFN